MINYTQCVMAGSSEKNRIQGNLCSKNSPISKHRRKPPCLLSRRAKTLPYTKSQKKHKLKKTTHTHTCTSIPYLSLGQQDCSWQPHCQQRQGLEFAHSCCSVAVTFSLDAPCFWLDFVSSGLTFSAVPVNSLGL